MRIHWFSPLPPSRTGIAEYSEHVLAAFAQRSEVIIWTDQAQWSPRLEQFGQVRRFDETPDWAQLNRGDATFYNIGNNADFHANVWEISRRHPGIVILHDTCLQHLFVERYIRHRDQAEAYCSIMARHYGRAGREAADTYLKGGMSTEQLAARFPLTELGLDNALAAVVHLPNLVDHVARSTRRPVAYAPLPYTARPDAQHSPPRANHHDRARPPFRLIVFGYLGPNRRLNAILHALETLPQRENFRLHVYGKLHKPDRWRRRIQRANLSHLVTLHGFVSDQVLDEALDQTDLAINLRYPSMGEASWTQLRLWSHGLPSLVTQTGWYAMLPSEAVSFVQPAHEVADIQGHLQAFLNNPSIFAAKGEAALRILQDVHAPERYVDALLDVASQAEKFRGRVNAFRLVERTGEILSQFASNEEHGPWLHRIASEIRRLAA